MNRHTVDRRLRAVVPRSAYVAGKGAYYQARALVRRNPGRGHLLPDFMIIGSPKCGTTSLHGWLTQHPLVAATQKEIHFFNINYHRRADWYRTHFPLERERDEFARTHGRPFLVGEGTASYLAHIHTPQRAAALLPHAKLIVCLRDPVERAYSQYHYFRRRGSEPLESFEEAIEAEEERLRGEEAREVADPNFSSWRLHRWGYLRTSRYAEHLVRWFEHFPREQFLILHFERDLVAEPERTFERLQEFLDLPVSPGGELAAQNTGSYDRIAEPTRAHLNDYFAPHNQRLMELTGFDCGWPLPGRVGAL